MKIADSRKINESFEVELQTTQAKKRKEREGTSWLDPMLYSVGIYLMTPLLIGALIGYSLDRALRTRPIFVIIFLILGTISSFYNFWKIVKR